jgi:hypothetical protein
VSDLSVDHLHVILDALQFTKSANIPEHFADGYDDPDPDDPKGTAEGWERLRAEAESIVGDLLAQDRLAGSADSQPCTCGSEAFAANQWWHFPDCPRAAFDPVPDSQPTREADTTCSWCKGAGIDHQQGSDVPCWRCRGKGVVADDHA